MSGNSGPSTSKDIVASTSQNGTLDQNGATAKDPLPVQLCRFQILEIKRKFKDLEAILNCVQNKQSENAAVVDHKSAEMQGIIQKASIYDFLINNLKIYEDYEKMLDNAGRLANGIYWQKMMDASPVIEGNVGTADNARAGCSSANYDLNPYEPNIPVVPKNAMPSTRFLRISDCPIFKANEIIISYEKLIGKRGHAPGEFKAPHGFCLGLNDDIVVADTLNNRIQVFYNTGHYKFSFGIPGRRDGYLYLPRKIAVMRKQRLYIVCDQGPSRSRIQLFTCTGFFFKKVRISAVDVISGVTVAQDENIIFTNSVVPTVFIVNYKTNCCKAIDCKGFIREPSDIAASGNLLYVCDYKLHCIVIMSQQGIFLKKFGTDISLYPSGIEVIGDRCVLVIDSHGNLPHIVAFSFTGEFISEYRCHSLQVSRCCGLKIASDGCVFTVDKNFHHVIMFGNEYFSI